MRLLPLLLLALAGIAQGQTVPTIEACLDGIVDAPEAVERGEPFRLSEQCPALAKGGAFDVLPLQYPVDDELTIAQVLDLRAALASAAEPAGSARLPDPATCAL